MRARPPLLVLLHTSCLLAVHRPPRGVLPSTAISGLAGRQQRSNLEPPPGSLPVLGSLTGKTGLWGEEGGDMCVCGGGGQQCSNLEPPPGSLPVLGSLTGETGLWGEGGDGVRGNGD